MTALLIAGAVLLGAGSLLPLWRSWLTAGLLAQSAGALVVGVAGAWVAIGGGSPGSGFASEVTPLVGADALSGTMLALVAGVAAPALLYAVAYVRHLANAGAVACLSGLFVLALFGVVVARDPSTFLGAWELMTLLPAVATLAADASAATRRAIFEYLAITHVGGAGVWAAMLVLADYGALGGAPLGASGATAGFVAAAALVGFGTKAGLVPLHAWLPRAHPVAPSHLSAVMSGAMVAVALYGLARVAFWWTVPPAWAGPVLLGVGAMTALMGILAAANQAEMKRLLAHSTIENMGIAAAGLGAAAWLTREGLPSAADLAFGAALLHLLTHAAAKGALFLGAGAVQGSAGTLSLAGLGGLSRRMPWTSVTLAVAGVGLAAVPPTAGFVSEWAVLQGVFATARLDAPAAAAVAGGALLLLAAAAGLAALAVAKLLGLALLGPARTPAAERAREAPGAMVAGQALLLAAMLGLVVCAGWMLPGLAGLLPAGEAPASGADLLRVPRTGGLAPTATLLVLGLATYGLVRLRGRSAAPAPIWLCGQPPQARSPWTGAGFTKSFRVAVDGVLRSERDLTVESAGGVVQGMRSEGRVPDLADRWLYRPGTRIALAGAARARMLQSGSLRAYIAWLGGLVLLALALLRAGVLG